MQEERDKANLPPIPQEANSVHSSVVCESNAETLARPIYTPSSSLIFDQERDPIARQISQSPIFIRGLPALSPILSGGLFDLKPALLDDFLDKEEEQPQVISLANAALSQEQSNQSEVEWEELKKKQKELNDIMAMHLTQQDQDFMKSRGINENQSALQILDHLSNKNSPQGKRMIHDLFKKVIPTLILALCLLKLYLNIEDFGFKSIPMRSDICPINDELTLFLNPDQEHSIHTLGIEALDQAEMNSMELVVAQEEFQMQEEPMNEDLKEMEPMNEQHNPESGDDEKSEFEQIEQLLRSQLEELKQKVEELKRQKRAHCEEKLQDYLRGESGTIVIPRACLSLLKSNQLV